jgi:hypothetical protein
MDFQPLYELVKLDCVLCLALFKQTLQLSLIGDVLAGDIRTLYF